MTTDALDAGLHVMVEKPMALEREGREQLLAAAARSGRLLVEDHNYRFNRPMLRLQHDLAAGHLGSLVDVAVEIVMPLGPGNRYGDRNLPSPSHRLPAGFIHEFITHLAYLAVTLLSDAGLVEGALGPPARLAPLPLRRARGDLALRRRDRAVAVQLARPPVADHRAGHRDAGAGGGGADPRHLQDRTPAPVGDQLSPPVNALLAGARTAGRGIGYVADRLRGRTAYEGLHELVRRFHRSVGTGSSPPLTPETSGAPATWSTTSSPPCRAATRRRG
jgi:hypothetical protein